jgi:hypothetical protein
MKNVEIPMQFDAEALKNLRAQKSELVNAIYAGTLSEEVNGIVHLIDHIQDYLADNHIFHENEVFDKGLPPETKEKRTITLLQHTVEYGFENDDKYVDGICLTDTDEEHIKEMIIKGHSEGEICNAPNGETEEKGWWKIEDPDHPFEDWQYEVANNETRLGYHEWVEKKKEEIE